MNDCIFTNEEKAVFALRRLYSAHGYQRYKMSKFEEYDLYVRNKDFLVSDGVITFTDTNGKLMALKPDVTISIVKNYDGSTNAVQKVYYNENVYRKINGADGFREIMQTGVECIGPLDTTAVCEVILLAAESLQTISPDSILDISHMGLIGGLIGQMGLSRDREEALMTAVGGKNIGEIRNLCRSYGAPDALCEKLVTLAASDGEMASVLEAVRDCVVNETMQKAYDELCLICRTVRETGWADKVRLDFSLINNMNYYNGIVFQGFVYGIPGSVLSGGRYDNLMARMHKKAGAVGFAVYLNMLERMDIPKE